TANSRASSNAPWWPSSSMCRTNMPSLQPLRKEKDGRRVPPGKFMTLLIAAPPRDRRVVRPDRQCWREHDNAEACADRRPLKERGEWSAALRATLKLKRVGIAVRILAIVVQGI